ncbi:hypothetical protein A1O1_01502 [Capronia coronata CBS 617.96]|uniref:G-patch domain-containing protein n=1 Tax=Capronia coronata CBS 617.96 TaxID=1182541 RepID=W9Z480_9EURO|nr:uncharacterized protein A1O1_01502 [Capronia coronata CBS 617.96]EXJ96376.1 hypothetical protein A1O1_01502 [Capronia coronata CBS 617.96]
MGLAEPRKRIKISHDPRNLSWSQSSTSFGQRLMAKHGWKEGQSLGNRESTHVGLSDADRLTAARVGVLFKDDNLGLGAKRKSRDVEAQRTGLDAFQGLLGRLNGKSDTELKEQEKRVEDRKLAMYVRGRWGGMVFVKGGVLVGDRQEEKTANKVGEETRNSDGEKSDPRKEGAGSVESEDDAKQRRKEEKRRHKEEKRRRREEKALKKAAKRAKGAPQPGDDGAEMSRQGLPGHSHKVPLTQAPDEPVSSGASASESETTSTSRQKRKRRSSASTSHDKSHSETHRRMSKSTDTEGVQRERPDPSVKPTPARPSLNLANGRHLLRGRNIQAKKMVFSDLKGLDEIFMRPA